MVVLVCSGAAREYVVRRMPSLMCFLHGFSVGRDVPRIGSEHGSTLVGPIWLRGPYRHVISCFLIAGPAAARVYRVIDRLRRLHGWLFIGVGIRVLCVVVF